VQTQHEPVLLYFIVGEEVSRLIPSFEIMSQANVPFRVLLTKEGVEAELLRAKGIVVDTLAYPEKWWQFLSYWKKFSRYYRMYDYLVVHAFGLKACAAGFFLKTRFNAVLICETHSSLFGKLIASLLDRSFSREVQVGEWEKTYLEFMKQFPEEDKAA
jgi:hypothetical protein